MWTASVRVPHPTLGKVSQEVEPSNVGLSTGNSPLEDLSRRAVLGGIPDFASSRQRRARTNDWRREGSMLRDRFGINRRSGACGFATASISYSRLLARPQNLSALCHAAPEPRFDAVFGKSARRPRGDPDKRRNVIIHEDQVRPPGPRRVGDRVFDDRLGHVRVDGAPIDPVPIALSAHDRQSRLPNFGWRRTAACSVQDEKPDARAGYCDAKDYADRIDHPQSLA